MSSIRGWRRGTQFVQEVGEKKAEVVEASVIRERRRAVGLRGKVGKIRHRRWR